MKRTTLRWSLLGYDARVSQSHCDSVLRTSYSVDDLAWPSIVEPKPTSIPRGAFIGANEPLWEGLPALFRHLRCQSGTLESNGVVIAIAIALSPYSNALLRDLEAEERDLFTGPYIDRADNRLPPKMRLVTLGYDVATRSLDKGIASSASHYSWPVAEVMELPLNAQGLLKSYRHALELACYRNASEEGGPFFVYRIQHVTPCGSSSTVAKA